MYFPPAVHEAALEFCIKNFGQEFAVGCSRNERLAATIAELKSKSRMECHGGRPDQWTFLGGRIIIATIDHDEAPHLVIQKVKDFIDKNDEWLDDFPEANG